MSKQQTVVEVPLTSRGAAMLSAIEATYGEGQRRRPPTRASLLAAALEYGILLVAHQTTGHMVGIEPGWHLSPLHKDGMPKAPAQRRRRGGVGKGNG